MTQIDEILQADLELPEKVHPDIDTVLSIFACPVCGEDRVDALVLDFDGDTATCATCGMEYEL